jgi:hypothetical protein
LRKHGNGRKELSREEEGELLHAKHALAPNSLGYCGPEENGRILEHLHDSLVDESLDSTLKRFEAAYPFVRMIAKSTGRSAFDYDVAEAYWIGNELLDRVEPSEFYEFSHAGLKSRLPRQDMRTLFREVGAFARPHHTFYVLGMYSRPNTQSSLQHKLLNLMDSCRISWGRVVEVKSKTLVVERPPLALSKDDALSLAPSQEKEIHYDSEIPNFGGIKAGDWVTIHWNFASEKLSQRQLRNLRAYTKMDIVATNRLIASHKLA